MLLGPRGGKQLNALMRLTSVGIEFSISTLIGLLGGRWLDGKFGTTPFLMIAGLVLGVVAGFRSLLRAARKASQPSQSNSSSQDDDD